MQIANAARAGAEYAVVNGYDQTNIRTAGSDATYAIDISNASVSASEVCGCPGATTGITATGSPPCSGTCTNGTVGTYVTVSAQGDYKPIFPWPGLANSMTFNSSAMVRIN